MWMHEALDWKQLWLRIAREAPMYVLGYNLYFMPPKPENCIQVWLDKQEYQKIKRVLLLWSYS